MEPKGVRISGSQSIWQQESLWDSESKPGKREKLDANTIANTRSVNETSVTKEIRGLSLELLSRAGGRR